MEKKTEQTTNPQTLIQEEPSLRKKYGRRIVSYIAPIVLIYALTAFISGMIQLTAPGKYEEFNPRRKNEATEKNWPLPLKAIDFLAQNYGDELLTIVNAPLRAMNIVTFERYERIRKKAFEIAGIDEQNPGHDAKRFKFYRELGIAVKKIEDPMQAVYIPFERLKEYIEKNSSYKIDKNWKESINEESFKGRLILQGKAYYKADTNKDGVVDDEEWEKTLHDMRYKSQKDVLEEITLRLYGKNKEELKTELEKIIKQSKENSDCLTGNTPETVPVSKLKEYVKE